MKIITAIETHCSSAPDGNFTMNFDPALSSESFRGRNLQTTRILSSDGASSIEIHEMGYILVEQDILNDLLFSVF